MMKLTGMLAAAALSAVLFAAPSSSQEIPVEFWAGAVSVPALDMSPDGQRVAMLMRRQNEDEYPDLVTFDTRDIQGTMSVVSTGDVHPVNIFWANNQHLVVTFLAETTFNRERQNVSRVASFDVEARSWTSLLRTPSRNLRDPMSGLTAAIGQGRVVSTLPGDPDHVLIAQTEELTRGPNYYRTNVATGRQSMTMRGGARFSDFVFDQNGVARGAIEFDAATNRILYYARISDQDDWRQIGAVDTQSRLRYDLLGFYDTNSPELATIMSDERGGNNTSIYNYNINTGSRELLFGVEGHDATNVIASPRGEQGDQIAGYIYFDLEGVQRYYVDNEMMAIHESLGAAFPGLSVSIRRISSDGQTILAFVSGPQESGSWYMIRDGGAVQIARRELRVPNDILSPAHLIEYTARDGLQLSGYVTIPDGDGPFPGIAMPHGGPWVRDVLGYDEWAQMLASKGYVVFQPNYRGSTNLGRDHWIAGDNQWGLAMQDDVDDGMLALVEQGVVDPDRMGFFGWSYGGYSAFAGAVREEPLYRCFVSGAGISDISRIRGGLGGNRFLRRFQRPTITGVSPIDNVDNVSRPILVVHGEEDRTVPVNQSRMFVSRLESIGRDVEYIEVSGMGHSPLTYEQNMQWYPQLLNFFRTKCGF